MDNKDFCRTLKRLRNENGRTQEWVANKIGVTRPTYLKWETGQTIPDINAVCKIADLLNISLDELTSRDIGKKETTYKTYADIFKVLFSCNLGIRKFSFCKGNIVVTSVYSSWIKIYDLYKNGSIDNEMYKFMCNSIIDKFKNITISEIDNEKIMSIVAPYFYTDLLTFEPCSTDLILKVLATEKNFSRFSMPPIDTNHPKVIELYKKLQPYIIEDFNAFSKYLKIIDDYEIELPFNF